MCDYKSCGKTLQWYDYVNRLDKERLPKEYKGGNKPKKITKVDQYWSGRARSESYASRTSRQWRPGITDTSEEEI